MEDIELHDFSSAARSRAGVTLPTTSWSRSYSVLTTQGTATRFTENDRQHFLELVHLVSAYDVPIFNTCLVDVGRAISFSGTLGRGGQYIVDQSYDNQRWPNKPGLRSETSSVYKRLLPSNSPLGADKNSFKAFAREVQALAALRNVENVVQMWGVAWEQDSAVSDEVCPILVLEFAPLGSLTGFIQDRASSRSFTSQQKRRISIDVARGLAHVHASEIIWGDCKPDNVLIYPSELSPGHIVAKLSDFGGCISTPSEEDGFPVFSEAWLAPEAREAKGFLAMQSAEIYSFGLLLWSIYLEGAQFDSSKWPSPWTNSKERLRELKQRNKSSVLDLATETLRVSYLDKDDDGPLNSEQDVAIVSVALDHSLQQRRSDRCDGMHTLIHDLEQTRGDWRPGQTVRSISRFTGAFDVERLITAYGPSTHLQSVARAIVRHLLAAAQTAESVSNQLTRKKSPSTMINERRIEASRYFLTLGTCIALGFGTDASMRRAASLINRAGLLGSEEAKGLYPAIREQAKREKEEKSSLVPSPIVGLNAFDDGDVLDSIANLSFSTWEARGAEYGCQIASERLSKKDPSGWRKAQDSFFAQLRRARSASTSALNEPDSELFKAVEDGDAPTVQRLVESRACTIDQIDELGQTPFLCAVRMGHLHIASMLANEGASVESLDREGISALHWIALLRDQDMGNFRELYDLSWPSRLHADTRSRRGIFLGSNITPILEAGTALDWAVDIGNRYAVRLLLGFRASPLVETEGRLSALHRTAARCQVNLLRMLLGAPFFEGHAANPVHTRSFQGESLISCAMSTQGILYRHLLHPTPSEAYNTLFDRIEEDAAAPEAAVSAIERDYRWLQHVNQYGENALYSAVKHGNVDAIVCTSIFMLAEKRLASFALRPTGSNRWSALRRSLYYPDAEIFLRLRQNLELVWDETFCMEESGDGVAMIHELAFCPEPTALDILRQLKGRTALRTSVVERRSSWHEQRLLSWGDRPELTVFQLAVVLQKFKLADMLVKLGADPLAGLRGKRFLGAMIEYQKLEADTPSRWLPQIVNDPVPNVLRRFTHPASIAESVKYLLQHDAAWWQPLRAEGWRSKYFGLHPQLDFDPNHDPMISFQPGLLSALHALETSEHQPQPLLVRFFQGRDFRFIRRRWNATKRGRYDRALVEAHGTSASLDSNALAANHRYRHVVDYGSFLLDNSRDPPRQQQRGHPYDTALEVALDMVKISPHRDQAVRVFQAVLETYSGVVYSSFPYFHYSPWGRTQTSNLSRRETVLHEAIRMKDTYLVSLLLDHGADWMLANANWQTPWHLCRLLAAEPPRDPDLHANFGSFRNRLWPPAPESSQEMLDQQRLGDTQIVEIMRCLEKHSKSKLSFGKSADAKARRPANVSSVYRALNEVRWPWSKYEPDDLGVRFLLYYLVILLIPTFAIGFPIYYLVVAVPHYLAHAAQDFIISLELVTYPIQDMTACFMETSLNGTDTLATCGSNRFNGTYWMQRLILPPMAQVQNYTDSFFEGFADCWDGTRPSWVGQNLTELEDDPDASIYVPGCEKTTKTGNYYEQPRAVEALNDVWTSVAAYLDRACDCQCTREGEPVLGKKSKRPWVGGGIQQ